MYLTASNQLPECSSIKPYITLHKWKQIYIGINYYKLNFNYILFVKVAKKKLKIINPSSIIMKPSLTNK